MANCSYFRTLLNDNFKILTWLLIIFIAITPNFIFMQSARASTSLGGWTIISQIAEGASTVLNASKTSIINGASVLKTSTAKITPNASQVAKVLRGGAAGYALSIAVEQLIGAVDWILDPANNQIIYTQPNTNGTEQPLANIQYKSLDNVLYQTMTALCSDYIPRSAFNASYIFAGGARTVNNSAQPVPPAVGLRVQCDLKNRTTGSLTNTVGGNAVARTEAMPEQNEQQKTLPLDVVAQKVIDLAESSSNNDHKVGAQVATTTAAQDMLANDPATQSDVETQLNTNAKTQTSEEAAAEATPKDPAAPEAGTDIKITFPVFCNWAPSVCEAANVVINFPTTLTNWWNTSTQAISTSYAEAKQFFKDEFNPDTNNSEVTVQQDNNIIFDDSQRINFSSSCPTPEQFNVSFFGASQNLEFSYQPLCEFMSMIKPFVIAGSYLIGAYIVMGLSRGSGE